VNASHIGAVRAAVDEVRLYFDVEGCGLAAQGDTMVQRPTLVLLHGRPGVDHSFLKPEFPRRPNGSCT
jgi:proline iminopeptidase